MDQNAKNELEDGVTGTVSESPALKYFTVTFALPIATGVTVGKGAKIGADKAQAKGIAVIGEDVTIEDGAVVEAGAMVPEV